MNIFNGMTPVLVWKYFGEILQIPRASKSEEKILRFLEEFAIEHKLEFKKDKVGNLLIKKAATKGMEKAKTVVLQSHVDMVCEKNKEIKHDFTKDPINAYIEGQWIKAKGTTLGADNGIGIAAELAVLADNTLKHGPIECLFTVDEETGLTGAKQLTGNFFTGKILLNLDSEDEGEIFIGCAGGIDTLITYPIKTNKPQKNSLAFKIVINGLKGGHSGDDINRGLANSNKILNRFLWNCSHKFKLNLSDFQGGNLRNAIPREAEAIIVIKEKLRKEFVSFFTDYFAVVRFEYSSSEPELKMTLNEAPMPKTVLKKNYQDKLLCSLYACPHGVIAMSQTVEGLVETSTNLASVHFKKNKTVEIVTSQRSSIESAKIDISNQVKSVFHLANASIKNSDSYPGWTPNTQSEILEIAKKVYLTTFKINPKVKAIHAGLECGLFLEKYPELDMISFGPTLKGVHSPDERMEIETVDKFWRFLVAILENIPKE
jgi:dipeptidase D